MASESFALVLIKEENIKEDSIEDNDSENKNELEKAVQTESAPFQSKCDECGSILKVSWYKEREVR